MKNIIKTGIAAGILAVTATHSLAQTNIGGVRYYDFTHIIPMFEPTNGDITKPNLSKPINNSKAVASFGFQATRKLKKPFKTQKGFFQWGWFHFDEHYTTHLDSTDHYLNKNKSKNTDKRSIEKYTLRDIIGPIVFIDISSRVTKELAKNNGKPSPNRTITDFGKGTGATVLPSDIQNVAEQIVDRAWIVVHSGWDKFFIGNPPKNAFMHPYINGLNYPGFGKAAVEKLIEIEKRKGIRINGIMMDNLSIDSGESGRGSSGKNPFGDGWYAHQLGLARGWKLLENASGTGQLKRETGKCVLIVGAIRLTAASGAPARVIGACH